MEVRLLKFRIVRIGVAVSENVVHIDGKDRFSDI